MKRKQNKSNSSIVLKKTQKADSAKLNDSLEDNSIDDIFRFDDKLIGKRTNTIFDAKPADDGFYDIINENLNSKISFDSEDNDRSTQFFETFEISEMDEKKNERMVRFVSTMHNSQEGSLTEIE